MIYLAHRALHANFPCMYICILHARIVLLRSFSWPRRVHGLSFDYRSKYLGITSFAYDVDRSRDLAVFGSSFYVARYIFVTVSSQFQSLADFNSTPLRPPIESAKKYSVSLPCSRKALSSPRNAVSESIRDFFTRVSRNAF